jgi:hypothetical protein
MTVHFNNAEVARTLQGEHRLVLKPSAASLN